MNPDDGATEESKATIESAIAQIAARGPAFYKENEKVIHDAGFSKEVFEKVWPAVKDSLSPALRATWEKVFQIWRRDPKELERYRNEEMRLTRILWNTIAKPDIRREIKLCLSDAEDGIIPKYRGPILDMADGGGPHGAHLLIPTQEWVDRGVQELLREVQNSGYKGKIRFAIREEETIFPPISMTHRFVRGSWKFYRLCRTIAARVDLIIAISPHLTDQIKLSGKSRIENCMAAGIAPSFLDIGLDAVDVRWNGKPDRRDEILLLAAESLTGNILRAALIVGKSGTECPGESVSEAEALLLTVYGLYRGIQA